MAFPVMDPCKFFSDYSFEISDSDAEQLRLTRSQDAVALVIVTVTQAGKEITANLAAPVVINSVTKTGMQIVLDDGRYEVRHNLVRQESREAENSTVSAA